MTRFLNIVWFDLWGSEFTGHICHFDWLFQKMFEGSRIPSFIFMSWFLEQGIFMNNRFMCGWYNVFVKIIKGIQARIPWNFWWCKDDCKSDSTLFYAHWLFVYKRDYMLKFFLRCVKKWLNSTNFVQDFYTWHHAWNVSLFVVKHAWIQGCNILDMAQNLRRWI
jgi:hypothetical protein